MDYAYFALTWSMLIFPIRAALDITQKNEISKIVYAVDTIIKHLSYTLSLYSIVMLKYSVSIRGLFSRVGN